jgi:hypothetical protein
VSRHPLNPSPDPLITVLQQYAQAHGHDYTTALLAAAKTAKEVMEYDATDLALRTLERCQA